MILGDFGAVELWGDAFRGCPGPSTFEAFATVKDNEKKLAAPLIWQRLAGAAKSVVLYLEPRDFTSETGLENLLKVLRESPLQKLPIKDSFSRLEKWSGLRRAPLETSSWSENEPGIYGPSVR